MTGEENRLHWVSRRTVLRATAAAGALAGFGGVGAAQEQRIELIGAIGGWIGQAPEGIQDEQNPTLELQAGQQYVLEWQNADGFDHNFVIIDADGNEVVRSEITSETGVTQTVEFEATEDMVEYFCEIHPGTMRGDLEVAGREEVTPSQEEDVAPAGPEIGLEPVAQGLTAPLGFETAPGVEDSYFVADQTGQIYVLEDDGLRDEPFLDVSDRMVELGIEELNGYDERGLLGLAFHPDFAENRRFFVRYSAPFRGGLGAEDVEGAGTETPGETTPDETTPAETTPAETTAGGKQEPEPGYDHTDVLAEFRASEDLTSADPESERVVMEIASPQDNHNGGALAFGPDGYLYSSIGDGGDADDTGFGHVEDWYDENEGGNGQDVEQNPLGSVLRIDVDGEASGTQTEDGETTTPGGETTVGEGDGGDGGRAYAVPEDNPLDPDQYDYPEQWAWGFRNPWRMSFNDGELFVGDAGQNLWEEIDIVENGGNYGWNVKEGAHCFSTEEPTESLAQCPDTAPDEEPYNGQELLDPIIEYPHRQATTAFIDGSVVIGGFTYEGDAVPELQGTYLFGNWSGQGVVNPDGEVFAATPPDGEGTETTPAEAETETTPEETPTETTPGAGEAQTTVPDAPAAETGPEGQYGGTWSFEELQIAGAEDGRLDRYVYAFGRDQDGELYVCTNRQFRPEGDTGIIYRIVPAEEGSYEPEETTPAETTAEETPAEGDEETTLEETADETTPEETPAEETTTEEESED